jgi:hypothetical protein
MTAYAGSGSEGESRRDRRPAVPAYGPVEAFLGFVLFLLVGERATPVVVSVVTDALPGVSPSAVGFGLAAFAWVVLAATVVDQATRQLAALGVGPREAKRRADRTAGIPSEPRALGYLAAALLGGAVAVLTFERGVGTAVASIPAVARLDPAGIAAADVAVVVAFFLSFWLATRAVDRLVVGGFRALLWAPD